VTSSYTEVCVTWHGLPRRDAVLKRRAKRCWRGRRRHERRLNAHFDQARAAGEGEAGIAQGIAVVLLEEVLGDEAWLGDPSTLGRGRLGCQGRRARSSGVRL